MKRTVAASRAHESGGRRRRTTGLTAEARARQGNAQFLPSFVALQEKVRDACRDAGDEWEAKVVAGIRAALEFAAGDPEATRALTVAARRASSGEPAPDQEVIRYFAQLLSDVAPEEAELPVPAAEATVESIATVIRGHLVSGTTRELPAAGPDLIYLSLISRLGSERMARWSDLADDPTKTSDSHE